MFVATDKGPLGDLGLAAAIEGTSLKLFAALPTVHQQEVQRLRQRFYIDSARWFDYSETPSLLPDLQQAVWEDRQMILVYRNHEGVASKQTLDAYALIAKASVWYVIARNPSGTYRTYRAARIVRLTLTDAHFQRDSSFDPAGYWKDMSRDFEHMRAATFVFYPAALCVTNNAFEMLREYMPDRLEQIAQPYHAGWLTIHALFLSLYEAQMHVLALGAAVRVLDPPELQAAVIASAKAIIVAHAQLEDGHS